MLIVLPEELIREVMTHLSYADLGTLLSVCKTLNRIGSVDAVWKKKGLLKRTNESSSAGSSSCPSPRLCHSSVLHGSKMYIYGGHNTAVDSQRFSEVKNDLFGYDIATKTWSKCSVKNLPSKTEHSSVVYKDNLYLYGGYSGYTFSNSTYMLNLTSGNHCALVKTTGEIPSGRSAHVGVTYGKKMYIFGGWDGQNQNNELFSFDFETSVWIRINSKSEIQKSNSSDTLDSDTDTNSSSATAVTATNNGTPCARCSHTGLVSLDRKCFYTFGGYGGASKGYLNDLWCYNFESNIWTQIETKGNLPSPRSRMRMVEFNGSLFIYGGWDKNVHYEDLYEFNFETKKWTKLDYGETDDSLKMGQHSLSLYDNILYIFGGYNSKTKKSTNDLFSYRLGKLKREGEKKVLNDSSTSSTPISSPIVNIREKKKITEVYNPFNELL